MEKVTTNTDMEGDLEVMDLPTLIQFIGQEGNEAIIELESDSRFGTLYFKNGMLRHAELSSNDDAVLKGEEAVYALLTWDKGRFKVHKDSFFPESSMDASWDFLLMEGLRRIDESQLAQGTPDVDELSLSDMSSTQYSGVENNAPKFYINKEYIMSNIKETLEEIMKIDGAKATAVVDWESGLTLGTYGNNGFDIDLAAAGNTNVVRSKLSIMKDLGLKGGIEDILITLTDQYHLIRLMENNANLFVYLALDRNTANLGMARHQLAKLEADLKI